MKCLEKDGKVIRVSDEEAADKVKKEAWSYCSKSKYKEYTRSQFWDAYSRLTDTLGSIPKPHPAYF